MHLVTLLSADNVRLYSCSLLSPRADLSEPPKVGRPVLVCAGNLRISATEGREIAYLKIGTFSHPLMMRTKIWRVQDTLIFGQSTPGRFWTLEIPFGRIDVILSQVCTLRPKLDVSEPVEEEADNTGRGPSAAVLDAMETCKKRPQSVTSVYSDEHQIPQRSTSLSMSLQRSGSSRDNSMHEFQDHEVRDLDTRRGVSDRPDSSNTGRGGSALLRTPKSSSLEANDDKRFEDPDDQPIAATNANTSKYSFLDSDDSDEGGVKSPHIAQGPDNDLQSTAATTYAPVLTSVSTDLSFPARANENDSTKAKVTIPSRSPAPVQANEKNTPKVKKRSARNEATHEYGSPAGLGIKLGRSGPTVEQSPQHASASRSTSVSSINNQPSSTFSPRQGLERAFTPVRGSSLGPITPSKPDDEPKSPSPNIERPVTIATDQSQSAYKNEICRTLEAILVGARRTSSPSEESFGPFSPTGLAKNPVFIATPTQTFAEVEVTDDLFAPDSHFAGELTFDSDQTHLFKHPLIPASIYELDSDRRALRTKDLVRVGPHASNSGIGTVGAYISWQMINRICPSQVTFAAASQVKSARSSSLGSDAAPESSG